MFVFWVGKWRIKIRNSEKKGRPPVIGKSTGKKILAKVNKERWLTAEDIAKDEDLNPN